MLIYLITFMHCSQGPIPARPAMLPLLIQKSIAVI